MMSMYSHDREVSIANCYVLDVFGSEPWWQQDFLHLPMLTLRPTYPPVEWVLGLFPWGKAAGVHNWSPTSF